MANEFIVKNGLIVGGGITGNTLSATTINILGPILSGGTDLLQIFQSADKYITGSTFSNNLLTLTRNDNVSLSVLLNNFSGLTINGDENINGNLIVTGTTNFSGSSSFGNSIISGGTDLLNIFKPNSAVDNDKFITGSTFVNNVLTLTSNSGGTISTLIDNFSGLTVNGVLTTNTISATTYLNLPSYGILTYMFTNLSSNLATYKQAVGLNLFSASTISSTATTVTTSPTQLAVFATNLNNPYVTVIPTGVFNVHYELQKNTGVNGYYSYFTLYKVDSGGTETLLATSDNSSQISNNLVNQISIGAFINSNIFINTTDRLVIKIYATMLNNNNVIRLFYDDNTNSRFELPISLTNLTNTYITGATFVNNNLITTKNDGTSVSILINNFSGLTVNGNTLITGTTNISGQTSFGGSIISGGTNLSNIFKSINGLDVFVTGGTLSSGTATFNNNSGGTFNVTGFTNLGIKVQESMARGNIDAQQASNSTVYYIKMVSKYNMTVNKFGAFISSSSAGDTWYYGIYSTANNLLSSGVTTTSVAGYATTGATTPVVISGGTEYWLAWKGTDGSANNGAKTVLSDSKNTLSQYYGGFGLPTIKAGTSSSIAPYIYITE